MGLFEKLFPPKAQTAQANGYFKTLTAYAPAFRSWNGKMYESELVRAAIDARSRHISKLRIQINGTANPALQRKLRDAPNSFQTWSQWLYRLNTILDMQNTVFIVPVYEVGTVSGYFPVLPSDCKLVDCDGEPGLRMEFQSGETAYELLRNVGILTKFQYDQEFFGSSNSAMIPTLTLIDLQNQGIKESITSSATYRFMAEMTNFLKPEDLVKERERFTSENLQSGDGGGILLFPNTYKNIQQIKPQTYTVSNEEMDAIRQNVYNYFGVNADVIQNKALGDQLDAFFNGAIEPFMIQFSEVMTKLIFTKQEREKGNAFLATANRLQYMSVDKKIQMAQQLGDRGMITINEVRELFNYPPIEGGEKAPIRGEFYFVGDKRSDNDDRPDDEKAD